MVILKISTSNCSAVWADLANPARDREGIDRKAATRDRNIAINNGGEH